MNIICDHVLPLYFEPQTAIHHQCRHYRLLFWREQVIPIPGPNNVTN